MGQNRQNWGTSPDWCWREGREGERERGREGGREREREGGREGEREQLVEVPEVYHFPHLIQEQFN